MNILPSYRYQMADHKKSILIFYVVIVVLSLIFGFSTTLIINGNDAAVHGSTSGNEMATVIFLFVVGLCTFKETFLISLQNGVSRKTLFTAKLLTMLSVAVIMAMIDKIFFLLYAAALSITNSQVTASTFYEALYPSSTAGAGPLMLHAESFFFEVLLALAAMAAGYFITIMFYRLSKTGKVIVGAGVPVLFLMAIPWADQYFFNGKITIALVKLIMTAVNTPSHMAVTCLLAIVVFNALAFTLMRKAVVKQ